MDMKKPADATGKAMKQKEAGETKENPNHWSIEKR